MATRPMPDGRAEALPGLSVPDGWIATLGAARGGSSTASALDRTRQPTAALDLELAIADRARDVAGGADQDTPPDGERALVDPADLGLVDLGLAVVKVLGQIEVSPRSFVHLDRCDDVYAREVSASYLKPWPNSITLRCKRWRRRNSRHWDWSPQ